MSRVATCGTTSDVQRSTLRLGLIVVRLCTMANEYARLPSQAADVWSCGVTLYTMLVGAYPFEDLSSPGDFRKAIVKIISADFNPMPAELGVSAECQDLLRRIFVAQPAYRISVSDLAAHPWFRKNFPSDLQMVRPVDAFTASLPASRFRWRFAPHEFACGSGAGRPRPLLYFSFDTFCTSSAGSHARERSGTAIATRRPFAALAPVFCAGRSGGAPAPSGAAEPGRDKQARRRSLFCAPPGSRGEDAAEIAACTSFLWEKVLPLTPRPLRLTLVRAQIDRGGATEGDGAGRTSACTAARRRCRWGVHGQS